MAMKIRVVIIANKIIIKLMVRREPGTERDADKSAPNATPIKFE